jgi:hypothetical protein
MQEHQLLRVIIMCDVRRSEQWKTGVLEEWGDEGI